MDQTAACLGRDVALHHVGPVYCYDLAVNNKQWVVVSVKLNQSEGLSLVQIRPDTELWLVENQYDAATVYVITTHLKTKISPS